MAYTDERVVRDLLARFREKVGVRVPDGWGVHFLLVSPGGQLRPPHNFTAADRLADHLETAATHLRQKAALCALPPPDAAATPVPGPAPTVPAPPEDAHGH